MIRRERRNLRYFPFRKLPAFPAYAAVGLSTGGLNFALYTVLIKVLSLPYLVAHAISWTVATAVAYLGCRNLVFDKTKKGFFQEAITFFAGRAGALGLETVVLIGCVFLGVWQLAAKVLGMLAGFLFNYLFSVKVVFTSKEQMRKQSATKRLP